MNGVRELHSSVFFRMPKIKEIKLKIESVIENIGESGLPEGESERTVTESCGFIHYTENGILLTYSESTDSGDVYSDITYSDGEVWVKRRGALVSELFFKEGEEHTSIYEIPPYKFDATVKTRKIRVALSDEGGQISLFYNMKIGGAEKSARMKIWISTLSEQN